MALPIGNLYKLHSDIGNWAMPKCDDRQLGNAKMRQSAIGHFVQVCSIDLLAIIKCMYIKSSFYDHVNHVKIAQCQKLAISPIGELSQKARKSDFVNIVI
jgi:hypothetical protein